ncbi:MAG: hypothetical protein HKN04_14710 [Rhodothermaceae bacterium]|nr:hypothetical protein [Rhodothermaceae bacterium]
MSLFRWMGCLAGLMCLLTWPARAQIQPGLTGEPLRQALVADYTPTTVLSDAASKDTLYAVIDRTNVGGQDGVLGLYTEYFVPFDCSPSCDPSQDVFNNNAGINQEHTWPRSEGAGSGNAERDLHHLFPTRVVVNSDRASLPFGESDDGSTTAWYYLNQSQGTAPPVATRDLWSERQGLTRFEPRESVKGDVARALFYFYTIYGPNGTDQASTAFFDAMKETLLDWHEADPPTAEEEARSLRVADYQATGSSEPAINPFVHDATLVRRAYFESAAGALTVLLEGAYDVTTGTMRTDLSAVLPETDPYGLGQSVASGFFTAAATGQRVVDWLRLELRTGDPMTGMTVVDERAALLLDDGTVVGTNGTGPVTFAGIAPGAYYVAVFHRNHLAAMTPGALSLMPSASYDFTSGAGQAYGTGGQTLTGDGQWALWAADGSGDGQVTAPDFNAYNAATASGTTGYAAADYTLDGQVTAPDFNTYSANTAAGATTQVPVSSSAVRAPAQN